MGNILLYCYNENEKDKNVIHLSESCIERLTREQNESEEISKEGLDQSTNIEEKKWMIKLRCYDEEHSNLYGLTLKAFEDLAFQVERQIEPIRPRICSHDEIVQCLKKNSSCSIRCRPIMERYIDCIETFRVNIIKEQIECELKEKRKEDQEIVEQFLKNDTPSQYN